MTTREIIEQRHAKHNSPDVEDSWSQAARDAYSRLDHRRQGKLSESSDCFVSFGFHIDKQGHWSLEHIGQVAGSLVIRDSGGYNYRYVYESYNRKGERCAQFLTTEPFLEFAASPDGRGCAVRQGNDASVNMNVPHMTVKRAIDTRLGLRLYRLGENTSRDHIDPVSLEKLSRQHEARLFVDIKPQRLSSSIRKYLIEESEWSPK